MEWNKLDIKTPLTVLLKAAKRQREGLQKRSANAMLTSNITVTLCCSPTKVFKIGF